MFIFLIIYILLSFLPLCNLNIAFSPITPQRQFSLYNIYKYNVLDYLYTREG